MQYQKVLKMFENIPYLSVGLDVGADFSWMSILLPNDTLAEKPFKIVHSLAVAKIKEAQEAYSLKSRCFLRDKGFDCSVIHPIITKNSTNMNVRKLHNDKFDSKKAAKVGLASAVKQWEIQRGQDTYVKKGFQSDQAHLAYGGAQ